MKKPIVFLMALTFALMASAYIYLERANSWAGSPVLALERKLLDFKFLLRGRVPVEPRVVIAAGDEKTIAAFGRWGTWDRGRFGRVINNLVAAGADVIAFDMVFADPVGLDHEHTAAIGRLLQQTQVSAQTGELALRVNDGGRVAPAELAAIAMGAKGIEDAFTAAAMGDEAFAKALSEHDSRVVQGFVANLQPDTGAGGPVPPAVLEVLDPLSIHNYGEDFGVTDRPKLEGGEKVSADLRLKQGSRPSDLTLLPEVHGEVILPQTQFLSVAANIGFFNADPDPDGVMRRLPLVYRAGELLLPSLSLSAAASHFGGNAMPIVDSSDARGLMRIGFPGEGATITDVPVDPSGALMINYYGPTGPNDSGKPEHERGVFPYVSLVDIERNTFDAALVKGKIVLVAVTAIGTFDQRVTPFSSMAPGTEVHAAAMQNMVDGVSLRRPWLFLQVEILFSLVCAVLLALVLPRVSVAAGVLVFIAAVCGWFALDFLVLFRRNMWFYDVPFLFQLSLTWAGITVLGYLTTGREKARLKKEFSTVLAPTVVDQLLKDPTLAGLGGAERELTVMFSDIRGFTSMSEKLTPEGLTQFLNEYLTPMTELLIKHEGTLDKYMGDAIMAFWGAPIEQQDHAARAALTAVEMLEKLDELKQKWRAEGKPDIDIGIGLNSGLMRVGFMGSERMRNYTLLGDNVNLGSRLEGTNKNYGTHIIVSETTYRLSKRVVYGRWLDAVRVKGKKEPVDIYEILGKGSPSEATQAFIARFEDGLRHYRGRRFDEAEACFRDVLQLRGGHDGPSEVYLERCEHFRADPPPPDWDGVYEFKTK